VALNVTHSNLRQLVQELRFDLHSSIADVKQRLYTFNGSQTGSMELHLKDSSGNLLARMLDEGRPLGYYGACSGMTVHVVDNDPYSLSRDGGCVRPPPPLFSDACLARPLQESPDPPPSRARPLAASTT
jgi:tubulin-folding cofactor B